MHSLACASRIEAPHSEANCDHEKPLEKRNPRWENYEEKAQPSLWIFESSDSGRVTRTRVCRALIYLNFCARGSRRSAGRPGAAGSGIERAAGAGRGPGPAGPRARAEMFAAH